MLPKWPQIGRIPGYLFSWKENFVLFCLVFHLQSAAKQTVDIASDRRTERSFRRKHRSPRVDRRRDDVAPSRESKLVSNL